MPSMNEVIGEIAKNTYHAIKPSDLVFGTVTSITPLEISVEQKMTLTRQQLFLSTLVSDFDVSMSVDHMTESAGGEESHSHRYVGTKSFRVKLGLQVGDKVMMLRQAGGQKYLVLDRVR